VACASCHEVPTAVTDPGHISKVKPEATLTFSGPAIARGVSAAWDGTACARVACHGAGLEGTVAASPVWTDGSGAARACGACHGVPPAAPHTQLASCESLACHGAEGKQTGAGPAIEPAHASSPVDGVVDLAVP
jgi:predicted CxxxxCH...CXXCH cytochrome family protein